MIIFTPNIFGFQRNCLQAFASIALAKNMNELLLFVLLFSGSSAFEAIDTGLGRKDTVQNHHLIDDFGILAGDQNTTLPENFTICSSISTADAKSPVAFFQLLDNADQPCTPCYKKSILGSKWTISGINFFFRFLLRLSENNHSRVIFMAKFVWARSDFGQVILTQI